MKLFFDLFPVILFFLAYMGGKRAPEAATAVVSGLLGAVGAGSQVAADQAPILLATAVAIVASVAQVGWLMARGRKVDKMLWMSLGIIVVMGGATLLLRDPTFIKWKPTVLYWAFAAVLLGAEFLFGRNLIRGMMQQQISLPEPVWARLNLSWGAFFFLMGALNLYVAYNFSESAWVNFKLFGGIGTDACVRPGAGADACRVTSSRRKGNSGIRCTSVQADAWGVSKIEDFTTVSSMRERLAVLDPELVEIYDESGEHIGHAGAKSGGGHYRLLIVSRAFEGRSGVARHRMVYGALGAMMQQEIHALAITAYTPEELNKVLPA